MAETRLTPKQVVHLNVNGQDEDVAVRPTWTLLDTLRDIVGLTGTKMTCETGDCGACTVLVDGEPFCSCLLLSVSVAGRRIETIEGLYDGRELHPLQDAFLDHGASQCGFCTPGMIMTAKALLEENPSPTDDEVRVGLGGNLCRCTGYSKIVVAVQDAARRMSASAREMEDARE